VRFRTDNAPLRGQTDQTGSTLITGLEPYRETPVAIDVESLEDPFWKPADQKIAVLPRPGSVVQLSFPVYETGAIDGTVEIDRGGQRVPLPGVRVQAFDANGKVAAETISGYDGFFFLEAVRLGRYVLRVDPDQLVRLHLAAPEPQAIALSLDKPTISAGMITLTRVPAAAPAPGAAVSEPKTRD
jgi:outer membrane usher protein FimD/PapC